MKGVIAERMKKLAWRHWLLIGLFLVALFAVGFFGFRAIRRAVYWSNHKDEQIKPWMSVRYVAHSYRVPPPVLFQALGLEPTPRDKRPLRIIASEQNRPVEVLISKLDEAIKRFRQSPRPPPLPATDGGTPR